jgi:hypothetical protein
MGGGHVEALRWYQDGNLLGPPGWFSYAWFGLPEHQLIQNGGWVLPIALVAEFLEWSPRNATLVQLGYIWFGGVAAFAFARALRWQWSISFLVGFIYLFSVMSISNAQHSAMVRAAALLPLMVMICLPAWVLKSVWLIPISGLVWWQAIVSSYPGNLVPVAIVLSILVVFVTLRIAPMNRIRYLTYFSTAIMGGSLLAAPRWLPVIFDRQSFPIQRENTAALTWELIPTLISSFDLVGLPNDVTMRSIWLAPVCLGALALLRRKNSIGLVAAILMGFSLLMMTELPFVSQAKDFFSILRVSTFAISDWRPILVLAGAVLVGSVLSDLLTNKWLTRQALLLRLFVFMVMLLAVSAIEWARSGELLTSWVFYVIAFVTIFILIALIYLGFSRVSLLWVVTPLAVMTFLSFNLLASTTNRTWQTDRGLAESYVYSAQFDDLTETASWPISNRPPRWFVDFPPLNYAEATADARYNRYWVTGEFGAVGNHNVKFSPVYQVIIEELDKGQTPLVNFLSTSSRQLIVEPGVSNISNADLTKCASNPRNCNPNELSVRVSQQKFDKAEEVFLVRATEAFTMVQNEAFHRGWTFSLCPITKNTNSCVPSGNASAVNESLRAWHLPAGNYQLVTFYVTPGEPYRWWLSGVGVALLLGFPLLAARQLNPHRVDRV